MVKYFIIPGFRKSGTTYAHDMLSQTRQYNRRLQKETQVYALKNITSGERMFFEQTWKPSISGWVTV